MLYKNMLTIPDGTQDTFFGFLAIIAVIVLVYAFGFSEIAKRRVAKAREAKRLAVEGLNLMKMQEGTEDEDGENTDSKHEEMDYWTAYDEDDESYDE